MSGEWPVAGLAGPLSGCEIAADSTHGEGDRSMGTPRQSRSKAMKRWTKAALAGLLPTIALATAINPTPAEAASTIHGCRAGWVCIYPQNKGWNGDKPEAAGQYYTYGPHNLYNQFGTHRIFNNQTGGAAAWTCYGYNGTGGSYLLLGAGGWSDENLTPINSVYLTPSTGPLGYDPCR
jgi:hypothetical protein